MVKTLSLRRSQAMIHLVNPNVLYALWPRGGGKTTGGIGPRINRLRTVMPRSQCILYSDTYERIHDRLLPNIIEYLQSELELEDGSDFVSCKRPPDNWAKPLIPLNKFDHVITFNNGFSLCAASQKVEGSANAYNAQSLIVDEAKYIKEEKINTEVLPAIRGARKWFGHLPEYRSQWYFTDKWGANIKWLLDKRRLQDPQKIKAALTMQLQLNKLQIQLTDPDAPKEWATRQSIILEKHLAALRQRLVYVSEAKPYENIESLGAQYFKDLKRDLKPLEYSVAILNEDPLTVENTFYPELDAAFHFHRNPNDVDPTQPLIFSMDYNWRITPMVVGQFNRQPGSVYTTFNIIGGFDSFHPTGGIEATLAKFVERFITHHNKLVHYCFDHTAVGKNPAGKSYRDIVTSYLRSAGWVVVENYMMQAPEHGKKYENMKLHMINRTEMAIQINKPASENLVTSLQNAGVIMSGGVTKKDKRTEKDLRIPVTESTDYSDAFDQLIWAVLELKMVSINPGVFADFGMK